MNRNSLCLVGLFLLGLVIAPTSVRAQALDAPEVKLKTVSLANGVAIASSTRVTLLPGVDVMVPSSWSSASTATVLQTTFSSGTSREMTLHVEFSDPRVVDAGPVVRLSGVCPRPGFGYCSLPQGGDGVLLFAVTSTPFDVRVTSRPLPYMQMGTASWYAYKQCRCAASPDFPKGTRLRVRRADMPSTYTIIRVNDFGPERNVFPDRVIDLDVVAFAELASRSAELIRVTVEPVATDDPEYVIADKLPPGVKVAVKKTKKIVKKAKVLTRK